MCNREQRLPLAPAYSHVMKLRQLKMLLGMSWVLTAMVIAVTLGVNSVGAAGFLIGVGLVPPALMLVLWNHPRQTLSESIQRARR